MSREPRGRATRAGGASSGSGTWFRSETKERNLKRGRRDSQGQGDGQRKNKYQNAGEKVGVDRCPENGHSREKINQQIDQVSGKSRNGAEDDELGRGGGGRHEHFQRSRLLRFLH